MTTLQIYRDSEYVGDLVDPVPDMWYLEGRFVAVQNEAGFRFERDAAALNIKVTFHDFTKAIHAKLKESPSGEETTILILSLSNGAIYMRRVNHPDAIKMVESGKRVGLIRNWLITLKHALLNEMPLRLI